MERIAIVTGAANGLGLATTHLFVQEGATVVAVDIDEETLQQQTDSFGEEVLAIGPGLMFSFSLCSCHSELRCR